MKKRGTIGIRALFLSMIVIGLIAVAIFLPSNNLKLTGNAVSEIQSPNNCSNGSIKMLWDNIFRQSSEGINIVSLDNGTNSNIYNISCPIYIAYKVDGDEVNTLIGMDFWFFVDREMIMASNGKFTQEYLSKLQNVNLSDPQNPILSISPFENQTQIEDYYLQRTISSTSDANLEFASKFKIDPETWQQNVTENSTYYYFLENATTSENTMMKAGLVSANYTANYFIYSKIGEFFFPTGVEGDLSSVSKSNINNLTLLINNNSYNSNTIYSGNMSLEFYDDQTKLFNVSFDFTNNLLNFSNIKIIKNPPTSNYSYIIINGINASKTIYLENKTSSNDLCLKDEEINSINEISLNCNRTNEYFINCPGTNSSYSCNITNGTYEITGLRNSAVTEISSSLGNACEENWTCEDWGICQNGQQTRICYDENNCGTTIGKPSELQSCTPPCDPSWECTEWGDCEDGTQTRDCTDSNNCGTTSGRPSETKTCEESNMLLWIIIGVLVLLIGGVVTFIILYMSKNKDTGNVTSQNNQGSSGGNNSPPGNMPPQQPMPRQRMPVQQPVQQSFNYNP